jgi:hypothetical protein
MTLGLETSIEGNGRILSGVVKFTKYTCIDLVTSCALIHKSAHNDILVKR